MDFIAASFVRKGSDVKNLRKLLADNGGQHIKIICKIENQEGLENYDEVGVFYSMFPSKSYLASG